MKRYLCFACEEYYPGGGMNDFREEFDDLEEAKKWFKTISYPHPGCHIYDQVEKKIILQD